MFLLFVSFSSCARYALLFAGSKEFFNYRHQADIYTIYGQLLLRGFTKKDIKLYAYDDIATDPENIYQGQVFHTLEHKDNVYPGTSAIDIKGDKITPDSFLTGITTLPTTSEDYVLIFFNNHGGDGTLGTPVGENINAYQLSDAFDKASSLNLYKQCLFLIESCFSGSIAKVFKAPNLATITASNDRELSHAAVWDSELNCWLTNEFTNSFITLIDESPEMLIGELYTGLVQKTDQSHVSYYGDESIQKVPLSNFIGLPKKKISHNSPIESKITAPQRKASEMTLEFLALHKKPSIRAKARIQILRRKAQTEKLETSLDMIVKIVDPKNYEKIMNDKDFDFSQDYFDVLNHFTKKFGEMNPDDFGRFSVLKALVATHPKDEIIKVIDDILG